MKDIEVDESALRVQTEQLKTRLVMLQGIVSGLSANADNLQKMWNGPAHDTFYAQFSSDHDSMEDMCEVIQNIIEGMEDAGRRYKYLEAEMDGIVGTIHIEGGKT